MNYNPSIWDSELESGRRDYIYNIIVQDSFPIKLRELAITLSDISLEPNHAQVIRRLKNFHNSKYRRILTADIAAINASSDYRGIIVHGANGVEIGTRLNAEAYVRAQYAEAVRKLVLTQKMAKKLSLDGQFTLTQEIIDVYERSNK